MYGAFSLAGLVSGDRVKMHISGELSSLGLLCAAYLVKEFLTALDANLVHDVIE